MDQRNTQLFLAIIIFLALGTIILLWFLDKQCDSCQDKKLVKRYQDNRGNRQSKQNNKEMYSPPPIGQYIPSRMDRIYDSQDYYSSHPFIYPTPNSFVTSTFAIKRELKERGGVYE